MQAYNYLLNTQSNNGFGGIMEALAMAQAMKAQKQKSMASPLVDSLSRSRSTPTVSSGAVPKTGNGLLNMLSSAEGTGESGYDVTYGYGKYDGEAGKPLSQMTLGEVYERQKSMKSSQKGNSLVSSAVGKYQFIEPTLRGLAKQLGISEDTKFTPEIQDMLAEQNLKNIGLDKWRSGELSDTEFQKRLSRQWASIPDPYTGKSYYGQRTGIGNDEVMQMLSLFKNQMIGGA